MIPNELDKRTAEELVAELFPGAVPPVAMFKIEQRRTTSRPSSGTCRRLRYEMPEGFDDLLGERSRLFFFRRFATLRRMFEQPATRISPVGNKGSPMIAERFPDPDDGRPLCRLCREFNGRYRCALSA